MPHKPIEFLNVTWLNDPNIEAPDKPPTVHALRRSRPSESIHIDDLTIPPFENDPQFDAYFADFIEGRSLVGVTRLDRSRIQLGFRRGSGDKLVIDGESDEACTIMRGQIKSGARPTVWLYLDRRHTPSCYVSSDDTPLLMAYDAEGVSAIPCTILSPDPEQLEHSAFALKTLADAPDRPAAFTNIIPATHPLVARILGVGAEEGTIDVAEGFAQLEKALVNALDRLRHYHRRGFAATHYHHSFATVVARAARLVRAVQQSCPMMMPDVAAVVVRALYELWLSLFVDWLAPELIGPVFKTHATSTSAQRKKAIQELAKRLRAGGWPDRAVHAEVAARNRLFKIVESPSERANINPAATLHHKIYPQLCHFAHQDFAAASPLLGALSSNESPTELRLRNADERARFLLQVSDIAVGGIVWCLQQDTSPA